MESEHLKWKSKVGLTCPQRSGSFKASWTSGSTAKWNWVQMMGSRLLFQALFTTNLTKCSWLSQRSEGILLLVTLPSMISYSWVTLVSAKQRLVCPSHFYSNHQFRGGMQVRCPSAHLWIFTKLIFTIFTISAGRRRATANWADTDRISSNNRMQLRGRFLQLRSDGHPFLQLLSSSGDLVRVIAHCWSENQGGSMTEGQGPTEDAMGSRWV